VNCKFCLDHVYSTRISAPSLIWLKLEYCSGAPPLLEGMASLESACIRFGCGVDDFRMEGCYADCCGECVFLYDYGVQIDGRVLLQGLSNASTLEFRASFGMVPLHFHPLRFCILCHLLITIFIALMYPSQLFNFM
jgi:hypothetical protein